MKFILLLPQKAGIVAAATIAGLVMSVNTPSIAQVPPPPTEGTGSPFGGAPVPPSQGGRTSQPGTGAPVPPPRRGTPGSQSSGAPVPPSPSNRTPVLPFGGSRLCPPPPPAGNSIPPYGSVPVLSRPAA